MFQQHSRLPERPTNVSPDSSTLHGLPPQGSPCKLQRDSTRAAARYRPAIRTDQPVRRRARPAAAWPGVLPAFRTVPDGAARPRGGWTSPRIWARSRRGAWAGSSPTSPCRLCRVRAGPPVAERPSPPCAIGRGLRLAEHAAWPSRRWCPATESQGGQDRVAGRAPSQQRVILAWLLVGEAVNIPTDHMLRTSCAPGGLKRMAVLGADGKPSGYPYARVAIMSP